MASCGRRRRMGKQRSRLREGLRRLRRLRRLKRTGALVAQAARSQPASVRVRRSLLSLWGSGVTGIACDWYATIKFFRAVMRLPLRAEAMLAVVAAGPLE
eukprot:1238838-Amphidinium_carterae.1